MRAHSRRRHGAAALIGVLAIVLSACTGTPDVDPEVPEQVASPLPEATIQELQDAATFAAAAAGASGAIVGVWAPWSGEWVGALGTTTPGGSTAVTDDLTFRAATITRSMTCDALHVLAEQGTVSLSDSVTEYVSSVPDLAGITLGQLCDGTSGVGSYRGQLIGSWFAVPSRVWDARELASYGIGQARATEPGVAYRDSDAGYLLLGLALEKATGKTAAEVLAENVFLPLDLEHTALPTDAGAATAGMLPGFHSSPDAEGIMNCTAPLDVTAMTSSFGYTDSGVVTDIRDLGRYAQALASHALVPDDDDRFAGPLPVYADAPTWYTATGGALQAGTLIGQAGSVPGYSTAAFADPGTGLTVAVVLNNSVRGTDAALNLAWELAAIASKAPAAGGETAPEAGLPWTAQQYRDATAAGAVCPLPEAAPEG